MSIARSEDEIPPFSFDFPTTQVFISLFLIWLISSAAKMGYANLHFFSANNILTQWEENASISSEGSYNLALNSIILSNEMHPNNPKYIETLSNIQEWAVYGDYAEQSNFKLALSNYEKSAQLRPLWPWSWSAKSMTKWRLNEIDDDLWHALVMLSRTGPYTKDANIVLIDVSLMLIEKETIYAERANVLAKKHYLQSMTNSRTKRALTRIIEKHEAEELVANWLK